MKNLAIASVIVVLIVFTATFTVTFIDALGTDYSNILLPLFISSIAAIVALVVVLIWAIPVHLLLKRINQERVAWYILAAVVPSFFYIYVFKPFGNDLQIHLLLQALFCSFVGSLGAVAFWYIVVYRQRITRRLNRTAATQPLV